MDNELFDKHPVTVLLNRIAAKGSAITYGELAAQIKSGYGYEVNPHLGFSNALGRLQKTCSELDLPCISVMVVNQQWKPGAGFIPCYREIHPEAASMSDAEIRRTEESAVKSCADWGKLIARYGIALEELDSSYMAQSFL